MTDWLRMENWFSVFLGLLGWLLGSNPIWLVGV
jgi:hypothetical protein